METHDDDTTPIDERPKLKPDPIEETDPNLKERIKLKFRHWLKRNLSQ